MTSRERAQEWLAGTCLGQGEPWEIPSLAAVMDAHAAERVREALERAAQIAHVEWAHQPSGSAANAACVRINDAIRALLKEV